MGEVIMTRATTPEYRTGWDRIFGQPEPAEASQPSHSQPGKLTPFRRKPDPVKLPNTGLRHDEFSEYTDRASHAGQTQAGQDV